MGTFVPKVVVQCTYVEFAIYEDVQMQSHE